MTANGNPSHSLVSAAFPSGKMGQKSILGASFHSCCDPVRICGDTSFSPLQASLPVHELLWPVPVHSPETFPGSLGRLSPEARTAQPSFCSDCQTLPFPLLRSAWQECHKRGLSPLTPPFVNDDPVCLRSHY